MTSKITEEEVKKIAELARLSKGEDPKFIQKSLEEINSILTLVDELQNLDTAGISPLDGIRTIGVEDLREDESFENQEYYQKIRQNIINNFPNKKGDLLVLPGIFE